jgi:transcriptional regulator with XRE-family HTH domain
MPRRRAAPDPVAAAFGAAVRRIRNEQGKSQEAVAGQIERIGRDGEPTRMDAKYLASIEGGWHSPTLTTAKQIADALGVSLADLVRRV